VNEGNIGSARIIKMLDVVDDKLVVDSKGIYSIENYLTSRRLMYWSVYLHKTAVAYEKVLINLLTRAKQLAQQGKDIFAPPQLRFFLYNNVESKDFTLGSEALRNYELLDDNDLWSSIKVWAQNDDKILSILAGDMINRNIFKVEIHENHIDEETISALQNKLAEEAGVSIEEAQYLFSVSRIQKDMYDVNDDQISILYKDGTIKDITDASDLLNVSLLSKKIRKYYLCYQRF
jgi:HD superfamily phosphohydrolase